MCGIVGVFDQNGINLRELESMSAEIQHRGPDDEGFFVLQRNGTPNFLRGNDTVDELHQMQHVARFQQDNVFGFGHRRLSILDLSVSGHQPMQGENGCVITYNGEVYNYLELREELETEGIKFKTDSDTEVILSAYEVWGRDCVTKFIGMWAFCIYDPKENSVFCSRDRFGIKPFYFYRTDGFLAFASEVKSLFKVDKVKKELDQEKLQEYIVLGKLLNLNETLYKDIFELPAGNNLQYNWKTGELNVHCYYDLDAAVEEKKKESLELKDYEDQLQESIRIHMRSDVEVGSCLSGGLDSSAIVYNCLRDGKIQGYKTFSAVFDQKDIDESKYIHEFVERFPQLEPHYITPSSQTLWADLEEMIRHQDLPIASTSIFAQWEVMKLAQQSGIKVLLDGQGADESLGGYGFFTGSFLLQTLSELKLGLFLKESKAIRSHRSVSIKREMARAFSHSLPGWMQGQVRKNQRMGSGFLSADFGSDLTDKIEPVSIFNNFQTHSVRAVKYGLRELLRYEDRNSMAFSIESRVPFLDHRLVELGIAMPTTTKIKNGWTKYPIRKSLDKRIPSSIVWRKDKKGFATPQQVWKEDLTEELCQMIEGADARNTIFNTDALLKATHTQLGSASAHSEYWRFISLIKWMQINGFKG